MNFRLSGLKFDKAGVTFRASWTRQVHEMRLAASFLLLTALGGCVQYRPSPLPSAANLRSAAAALPARPLSLRDVAALAVLNDPDLAAARAQHGVAAAELIAAGRPPDPSITGGFAALLGGPGTMPAITVGFSQDIGALITYRVERQAAAAGLRQVDAGILWQEWQVAAQAEELAISIGTDQETEASLRTDMAILADVDRATQAEVAADNLTLNDGAASAAALAAVQSALATAQQGAAHDGDALDALLGLAPGTPIAIAPARIENPSPEALDAAMASLPWRRPDLIALRCGYDQADAHLRAAILTQFLPLSLGASGGRDTTGVDSAGPQISLTLPLFNRNRAAISAAEATRTALAAQYQAALDGAASGTQSLIASIALLRGQAAQAGRAADARRRDGVASTGRLRERPAQRLDIRDSGRRFR
jgi:outer membrane protein TolC